MSDHMKQKIQQDVKSNKVMLYMKGEKEMPMCGFSMRVVQILNSLDAQYETRNVLMDDDLRESIKEFSDWPTIPQLYIEGEFVGGSDIAMEMYQSGELRKKLEAADAVEA